MRCIDPDAMLRVISAMLACVARAQTPLLSAACRAAAARTTKPLRDCINLAPPSTGTRSLTQLMELYSPYAHHDHRVTVGNVQAADFAAGTPPPRRPRTGSTATATET